MSQQPQCPRSKWFNGAQIYRLCIKNWSRRPSSDWNTIQVQWLRSSHHQRTLNSFWIRVLSVRRFSRQHPTSRLREVASNTANYQLRISQCLIDHVKWQTLMNDHRIAISHDMQTSKQRRPIAAIKNFNRSNQSRERGGRGKNEKSWSVEWSFFRENKMRKKKKQKKTKKTKKKKIYIYRAHKINSFMLSVCVLVS